MNIFYLHRDPVTAASYMYNKHVVKMILESAQMLCTAHHVLGSGDKVPYKPAHINHPSTIWTRTSNLHYDWLYTHMLALGNLYQTKYGREHLTITKCRESLFLAPLNIPCVGFQQPPQCMPDEYKASSSIEAYWNYYIGEKYTVAHNSETIYTKKPNTNEKSIYNTNGMSMSVS